MPKRENFDRTTGFFRKHLETMTKRKRLEYLNQNHVRLLEWFRLPGDMVFIALGVVPMVFATLLTYRMVRARG